MELIATLTRIALGVANEYCLIDWHPDDFPPETYEAELEIDSQSGWEEERGDFFLNLNGELHCQVSSATMICWTASDLRPNTREGVLPYER